MKLSDRHIRFVNEYLIDLNATQAAIRSGYSEKTAYSSGQRLLKNVEIQAKIQDAMNERAVRTEIDQDRVLKELGRLGFSDIRKYFNDDGSLKNIADLEEDAAAAVSSVEVDELFDGGGKDRVKIGYTRKIKFWDKNSALEKIGKHLKMFTDKVEFPDENGKPQAITQFTNFPPEPKTMEEWEAMVHGKKTDKTGD